MSKITCDAIITWVDGDDPEHKSKIRKYQNNSDHLTINTSKGKTRFLNNGELFFCLKSIKKNATWINRIYIVTDSQIPQVIFNEDLKDLDIQIIDHQKIFGEHGQHLPTFNSISIESMIHNIPGLSENYIYFNDDFFILSEAKIGDFFNGEKVVLRGTWKKIQNFGEVRIAFSQLLNLIFKYVFQINRSMSLLQQMEAAKLAGFTKYYLRSPHYPHPQKKSTIKNFYQHRPEILRENIQYRFRNLRQHVAIFLSNHLEIKKDNADIMQDDDCLMICFNRDSDRRVKNKIERIRSDRCVKFLCVQSLEEANSTQKEALFLALKERGI